jgi:tRNA threonylcarbamoyladenosine biosynthesis protein TsaB
MLKIYLDTTIAKLAQVKIIEDERQIAQAKSETPLIAINQALQKANLKLSEIDKFEANPGPGSFTGIRIGATIANVLNWALGKKVGLIEPVYE